MIEESFSSQKNVLGQERSGGRLDRLSERREKGLWSFLTWSFFLSQMVGAEQASAATARSAGTADETAATNDANAGPAASHAFLSPNPGVLAEMQEAAAVQPVQSLPQVAAPTAFLAGAPAEFAAPTGMRSTDESSAVRQTSAAPASPVGIQPAANSAPAVTPPPELGGDMPGLGGPLLPSIEIPPVVEEVIAPVVGIVGDVVGDVVQLLDPVLEQVVAPIVGIVGDVVGDVVQLLDPVLEQVVAPAVAIVGDVVGDIVQVLDPVLEQVAAPVLHVLDPIVEQVVAPVVQALAPVVAPVVEALEPVVDQVLAPVADIVGAPLASLLGLGPGGGEPIILTPVVAASSGSIDFEGPPAAGGLPIDQLFSGGSYTDYNLALQGDSPAGASSAPGTSLHDVADSVGDIVGTVIGTNPSDDGNGGHGSSHHIGLPSLLGDLGLHGLGL